MSKGRIIINYEDAVPEAAMELVRSVMLEGRISNDGTQFCRLATFKGGMVVACDRTRNGTDVFRVWNTRGGKEPKE